MVAQEEELKEKYVEMQLIGNKMKQLESQIETVRERLVRIREVENDLDELKNTKLGSEALVPISEGIFVRQA